MNRVLSVQFNDAALQALGLLHGLQPAALPCGMTSGLEDLVHTSMGDLGCEVRGGVEGVGPDERNGHDGQVLLAFVAAGVSYRAALPR
jgi:hypothetical protein